MQILTVSIQRGGTAKTTTATAIAQAAAADGKRVLAIDLDPQGNFTFSLKADTAAGSSYDLLNGTPARRIIQRTESGIDVIPASWNLSTITSSTGSAKRLANAIKPIKGNYDLIVIDTPPTAGELQYNALQAATGLIIPLQADIYGLQGLYQIADTANAFKRSNPALSIKGIVLTRYDGRSTLSKQIKETIIAAAAEMGIPYLTAIREGIAIKEAQALQADFYKYSPAAKPMQDYISLYEMLSE